MRIELTATHSPYRLRRVGRRTSRPDIADPFVLHETVKAVARLEADPEALADWQREARVGRAGHDSH